MPTGRLTILKVYRKVAKDALASLAQIRHPREAECVASRFLRPSCATGQDLRYCVKTREESYTGSPAAQPLTQNPEPKTQKTEPLIFIYGIYYPINKCATIKDDASRESMYAT